MNFIPFQKMLSKQQQSIFRNKLFRHLDGIVTAPAAFALHERGVTDYLLKNKTVSLNELITEFRANEGYINIALRTLCSQGWLNQTINNTKNTVVFETNDVSEIAFKHFGMY
ncbi:MAG: class I SAM-dependent methyltransferase, partial [Flavobacteriaceae bacterium]|nr:class I SAM-dependent methyltransferase [Flavobacteriaceae bacterium]